MSTTIGLAPLSTVSPLFSDLLPSSGSRPIDTGRGGYTVTMRESFGLSQAFEILQSADGASPRLHVGWGSFRNLDILAVRRSEWALLLDVNVNQFAVWNAVATAMRDASTPSHFIDAVLSLLPRTPPLRQFSASTREWLEMDRERSQSWLSFRSPERFENIRQLFIDHKIETFCMDMRGNSVGTQPPFADLATRLRLLRQANRLVPDTLYISNVPWMLAQPSGFFGESHAMHLDGERDALSACRANLSLIAPHFQHIVSAMQLAPSSVPSNLQWRTAAMTPEEFLSDTCWAGLE